jgi:hypothetical protein
VAATSRNQLVTQRLGYRMRLHRLQRTHQSNDAMIGDLIFFVFGLIASVYSAYAWRKYADQDYLWFLLLGLFVISVLVGKMFFIGMLPASARPMFYVLVYCAWILALIALAAIWIKRKR